MEETEMIELRGLVFSMELERILCAFASLTRSVNPRTKSLVFKDLQDFSGLRIVEGEKHSK